MDDLSFVWESAASFVDYYETPTRRMKGWDYPREFVVEVLNKALALVRPLPTLIAVPVPAAPLGRVNICGDTHGQFFDLLNIFSNDVASRPCPNNVFLFNGDYVDRGVYSFEVPFLLLALKVAAPESMHLLRGNHECTEMNEHGGFADQVRKKYDDEVLELFRAVFQSLPVCAVVQERIFVTHGGIGRVASAMTLPELSAINRFREPFEPEGPEEDTRKRKPLSSSAIALIELLWCDPLPDAPEGAKEKDFDMNMKRGMKDGFSWGAPVTRRFLELNGLEMIVRSHQVCQEGASAVHGDKCMTVFSAPNYMDTVGNLGAVVCVTRKEGQAGQRFNLQVRRARSLLGSLIRSHRSSKQDARPDVKQEAELDIKVVRFASVKHPKIRKALTW